jgi:integrase
MVGPNETVVANLALADAQPTPERRMRAAGLVCLGAGAGLIRGDLREVRGSDVACRSGGVVVTVRGARPRTVPVLARYHARLDTSRLRATWLAGCAGQLGLATFMHAAGISCSQRLGDLVAGLEPAGEADAVRLLGAARS